MPIVQFHLVTEAYPAEAISALLVEASHAFAAALYPDMAVVPVERVRALVHAVAPGHAAVGGRMVSAGATPAPFFTCLTIAGRPRSQLDAMIRTLTDLVVEHLGCERALVRGMVIPIDSADWYIAGEPASAVRGTELARRSTSGAASDPHDQQ
ncbi:MAG: tautomerase family protein [Sphingomonadales bacterium]|nr:tautomerase family protein [Sphingomonadales bacterium]